MDTSHHQNFKGDTKKSTGRPDSGKMNSCKTTTSGSKSSAKTLIQYDIDESLDIKEEIIDFPETITVQTQNKIYASKFCTVHIKEEHILEVESKPQTIKEQEIPESKEEIKYTCNKCARNYHTLKSLKRHQKYACGAIPQYSCKFCNKLFKRKDVVNSHVDQVHKRIRSKKSVTVHKCDKCSRIYNSLKNLIGHKCVDRAAMKKQFICDYCEYNSYRKGNLVSHITLRHLPAEKQLICDYCQYKSNWKSNLVKHIASRHLQALRQFICDYCGYKSNWKSNLIKHITSRHLLQTSKSKHTCHKCKLSYNWLAGLYRHKSLVHASVKPQFICDYCGYNFYAKYRLVKHIKRHVI